MSEFPQRLPDLLAIFQPEVLQEVGLSHVAADRSEQVDERLKRTKSGRQKLENRFWLPLLSVVSPMYLHLSLSLSLALSHSR